MGLIGLDIGTTGCKACMFNLDGGLVAQASREYPVLFPQPGWAEQDVDQVWQLAQQVLGEVVAKSGRRDVAAIGLSVHGEALTAINHQGRTLRPLILGMDTRTDPQNRWLVEKFGAEELFLQTGMPVHTINTLPKLLWIRQNEPQVWREAARFMLVEDFLILRMTGQAAISRCLASRTQLFDLRAGIWSSAILEGLELEPERLSPVLPSGTGVARMKPTISDSLGFASPPMVVTGGHDQACGALGVGLTQAGLAMVSTGTAEVVEVAMASPTVNRTLFEGNISIYSHVIPGLYLAMTLNHSGGLLLRWFRDTFCQTELQQASQLGVDAYDLILAGAPAEPTGLLVLPHFGGSGTPTFDTASRGAILGLTFATRRADLAKAILEGLTYELRLNLDLLMQGGVAIDILRAIGGGAKSDLWLQLKADLTGIPVTAPAITEAASLGAALLAGEGAGLVASAGQAAGQFLRFNRHFKTRPEQKRKYDALFALYRQVYPAVGPISHQMQ